MNKKILKIMKVVLMGGLLVGSTFALAGCGKVDPLEDPAVQAAISQARADAQGDLDRLQEQAQAQFDSMSAESQAQAERDALVLADYKAEIEALKAAPVAVTEPAPVLDENGEVVPVPVVEVVPVFSGYEIDDVGLGEEMAEIVYSEDYEKLQTYEVKYEDDKYDVEESLILSGFQSKLNFADFGSDIVVAIENGAIEYKVSFDSEIVIVEDELKINFLGQPLRLVEYSEGEITYRLAEKFEGEFEGVSYVIGDKTLQVLDIAYDNDGDADSVYVDVDGQRASVEIGDKEEVNGLNLFFAEAFKTESFKWAKFYAGEEVEESVSNGDDYDADDRYQWVIEGSEDGLKSVGLKLQESYLDDDEVLQLGDSFSLPDDYLSVSFSEAKNIEVKDVELKVSNTRLTLDFEGKIEVDGRIVESKITFKDDGFEYEYKGDKEFLNDYSLITLFNGEREMSVEFEAGKITVGGRNFEFVQGDDPSFTSGPTNMNDDNDYRRNNGDILYASEVNEDEEVRTVKVGFCNDKDKELVFKVE